MTASRADPCAGGTVAAVVYSAAGFNGSMPRTSGAPLTGTLLVDGPCGTVSGPVEGAFEFISEGAYFVYNPVGEILRYPLSPTAPLPRARVVIAGDTLPASLGIRYQCPAGAPCERDPAVLVMAELGVARRVEGAATGQVHAWPDSVACGTTTPLPLTLTQANGAEGYVGPLGGLLYRLPGWSGPAGGVLTYEGTQGGAFAVPYADVRSGAVAYVAPACEAMVAGALGVSLWVEGMPNGSMVADQIQVVPPPPTRFDVVASPDTLAPGGVAWVPSVAVGADGTERYLDPATEVTLTLSRPDLGVLYFSRPYTPNVMGATITVPYNQGYGYGTAGARPEIGFQSFPGATLEADTDVTITASGGGLSGSATVTLLGPLRLDLTASPDSVATGGRSVLTATIAGTGAQQVPADATVSFALDNASLGTLRRTDTGEVGTMLAGVPRTVAAGGVVFEAVARQGPPALARGAGTEALLGSMAADSVWAAARVTATVDGPAGLTDTARIAVGGMVGLGPRLVCVGAGAERVCTVVVTLPAGDCAALPTVTVLVEGVRGDLVVASTGERVAVGEGGASVTVAACMAAAGGVTFEPDATGTIRIGTVTVSFTEPVRTPGGEPVLPGTTPVTSGPVIGGGGGECEPTAARGVAGAEDDECGEPAVTLLRRNGEVLSPLAPGAHVMVSKLGPNRLLPQEDIPFQSNTEFVTYRPFPDNGYLPSDSPPLLVYYDPDTYRLQMTGIQQLIDPAAIQFRVSVTRGSQSVPLSYAGIAGVNEYEYKFFSVICEPVGPTPNGVQTCRSTKYVRFVSNERPAERAGETPDCTEPYDLADCYDGEYAPSQTIRVELGDLVNVEVHVPLSRLAVGSFRVGSYGGGDVVSQVRRAGLRFIEGQGLENLSNLPVAVRRAREDWAQTAIDFEERGSRVLSAIPAVLELNTVVRDQFSEPAAVPTSGPLTVRVRVAGQTVATVTTPLEAGESVHAVAQRIAAELTGQGVAATAIPHYVTLVAGGVDYRSFVRLPNYPTATFEVVGGAVLALFDVRNRTADMANMSVVLPRTGQGQQNFENIAREAEAVFHAELHVLALDVGRPAPDDALVTAFVVPDVAMGRFDIGDPGGGLINQTYGLAYTYSDYAGRTDALVGSLVVRASAVDGLDRVSGRNGMPMILSHEVGHILLDGAHPGSIDGVHHNSLVNLMVDGAEGTLDRESPAGAKRLTQLQRLDVISTAYRNVNPDRPSGPTPLILETPAEPPGASQPALP